jgi:carbon monoxide dehydrogenase subunit G
MTTSRASVELQAPPEDVSAFLAEPHNLADWWPGIATVAPDRRGFARGARWQVRSRAASLFRRAAAEDTLLVTAAEPRRFAFELARAKVTADLRLEPAGPGRTSVELRVEEPFSFGFRRGRRARDALARLHDLVQTGAHV